MEISPRVFKVLSCLHHEFVLRRLLRLLVVSEDVDDGLGVLPLHLPGDVGRLEQPGPLVGHSGELAGIGVISLIEEFL